MISVVASAVLAVACLGLAFVAWRAGRQADLLRTKLAEAESGAQEQLSRIELLAESLPQAMWFGSSDGRTLFRNRRFAQIVGHGDADVVEDGVGVSVHPEDAVRYREARAASRSTGTASSLEVRLRDSDGGYRWWQVRVAPRKNASGQVAMWIGSFTDIHALKEAEAALRLSEERYRQILDTSHDAVFLVDRDSVIRFANDTVRTVFGHEPESMVGQHLSAIVPPGLRDAHKAGMARYVLTGERKLNWRATEVPALHRDGHDFPVEISFAEFLSNQERLFVAFIRDLSEQKEAERQKQLLEQRLREAQKLQAIGTLAGGVAHGINNALAAILGNLQIASESAGANADLHGSLDQIHVAARRARGLVRQVLLFSRKEALNHQRCDVEKLVLDTAAFLRSMLPDRIQIHLSADEGLPAVVGDSQQMELALVSLATNASEAIGDRDGRIDLRVDVVALSEPEANGIPGLRPGPHVRLRLEDDGKGMDAETLRRVFEPFFTTRSEAEHAGIGLSVVHGIMTAHHGAVMAESQPGRGSCFTLYFPAAIGAPVPALQGGDVPNPGPSPSVPVRILYVDDEEALVDLMQRLLKRRGYRVTGFTEPGKALDAVKADADAFDVVLTDQSMPGMTGIALARELRRLRPELPVAILSGHVSDVLRGDAAAAGVREVLLKENLVEQLCDRVEQFVRERGV